MHTHTGTCAHESQCALVPDPPLTINHIPARSAFLLHRKLIMMDQNSELNNRCHRVRVADRKVSQVLNKVLNSQFISVVQLSFTSPSSPYTRMKLM